MVRHFMQIVSLGDNLHEMSNPIFWKQNKTKNIIFVIHIFYPEW